MTCPNCQEQMEYVSLDNQSILHCSNCGCSFFDENGINRITPASAQKLAEDKKSDEISGTEKNCPKDQGTLKSFQSNAIPTDVSLLKCTTCNGIFIYPEDLIHFKKAQGIKVEFFKVWNMPIPSLKAILVLSFFAVVSISLFTGLMYQQKSISQSQASGLIKGNIYISTDDAKRLLFVNFKTDSSLSAEIEFIDKTTKTIIKKTLSKSILPSDKKTALFSLTTGDINLTHEIYYKIILANNNGKKIELQEKRLEIK
jgi:uncharacterized protein YbaR (Trm112 family)